MKKISQYNFSGKKALIRVDFNVPLKEGNQVGDNTRIKNALDTIRKVTDDDGIAILMSHLGRPKNGPDAKYSLQHLVPTLSHLLEKEVAFASDCAGNSAKAAVSDAQPGDVVLLENLRFHPEEKAGDNDFAKELAELGDCYVNDAFGTAHRAHASTATIAQFFPEEKMFGFLMEREIKNADKVLASAKKPYTAIIGGAKVSNKIAVLEHLLGHIDHLIIGGGMAFTFLKAQGGEVGASLVESDRIGVAEQILAAAQKRGVSIHLPVDVRISDQFSNDSNTDVCSATEIPLGWMGMDIGPETIAQFKPIITRAKTVLWNGPMGVFEMSNFEKGTKEVAISVAEATDLGAFSLVGGGDSVAAINQCGLANRISYVSTGGGALLEYLEGRALPGITEMTR